MFCRHRSRLSASRKSEPFSCPAGSEPKTNQTYVWGLTRAGNSLWFGTGPNVGCTTMGEFVSADISEGLTSVCEYGLSQPAREYPELIPASMGDVRPPKIYEYDLGTRTLYDRTPDDPNINLSVGFRSAGSHNGVVFLAGGSVNNRVIMFAFDANTRAYLGSREFLRYGTIRKWVVINNRLYTALGTQSKPGNIVRWTGSRTDPWKFVVVGTVDGVPREIAEYRAPNGETRIAISGRGIWISPPMNSQDFLPYSTEYWKQVWTPQMYEPDRVIATAYGGGGLFQFDGWLYWGTTHIPGRSSVVHESCGYPICFGAPRTAEEEGILNAGAYRSTSVWRARNLEGTPEIELLYGEAELPKFNPGTRTFDLTPNAGGYQPLYGPSGFGNRGNYYSWTMQAAAGRLFVGTLDLSGADLWRFDSSSTPAAREDGGGLGDYRNYGIRTMAASDDGNSLYCGMATYSNLRGYPGASSKPGWELRELAYPEPATKISSPVISPAAETFVSTVSVSVSAPEAGASIHYTLDGSEPTQYSNVYTGPILLSDTSTVKAKAFLGGYIASDTATATYIKAAAAEPLDQASILLPSWARQMNRPDQPVFFTAVVP